MNNDNHKHNDITIIAIVVLQSELEINRKRKENLATPRENPKPQTYKPHTQGTQSLLHG